MKEKILKNTPPPAANAKDCPTITEQKFMRDHTLYSAMSSWLFAIAGATNIGVLVAFSSKILGAAEKGEKVSSTFKNKKYNSIALGMTAFGGASMAVSNWLESKKVVTESQLLTGKMLRRSGLAEEIAPPTTPAHSSTETSPSNKTPANDEVSASVRDKNWAKSVSHDDLSERAR